MVRMSDPNYLRAELLLQARRADAVGKHRLAAVLREDARTLRGAALLDSALGAGYAVRS
jgi:hypothetical protein